MPLPVLWLLGMTTLISALCSGALAGAVLEIDWTAMYRDSIFYGGSIVLFIIFAWDGYLAWWEGLIEVFLYGLYIYCMKRNQVRLFLLVPETVSCCG